MKRWYLFGIAASLLLLWIFLLRSPLQPPVPGPAGVPHAPEQEIRSVPPLTPKAAPATPSLSLALPDADTYRAQAHADPHRTPAVVLAFARGLAPKMEVAFASPEAGSAFFSELRKCAEDPKAIGSVRTICAVNAGRLAERYPAELGESYREFRTRLEPELSDSVKAAGF